jgi:hypothetical protein
MKKYALLLVVLFLVRSGCTAERIILPDLLKPSMLALTDGKLYVVDGSRVHIYSGEDFRKLTTFGRRGEGPGEFKVNPNVYDNQVVIVPQSDNLFFHNRERFLYFSKNGEYQSEINCHRVFLKAYPFHDGFVALGFKDHHFVLSLYSSDLKELKELYRKPVNNPRKARKRRENKILILHHTRMKYIPGKDKIYLLTGNEFKIQVFNRQGIRISPIKARYHRLKITDLMKEKIMAYYRSESFWRRSWERVKNRFSIGEYYPAIKTFFLDQQRIYVQTHETRKDLTRIWTFKHSGKLLGRAWVKISRENIMKHYLYTIHNQKLYQLVPDEADRWQLIITGFKLDTK